MLYVLIIALILVVILYYFITQSFDVVYVKSDIDNEFYLVRDLGDKQDAANMLSKIKHNMYKLTEHLQKLNQENRNFNKQDMTPYIKQLGERIKNCIIQESTDDGYYTSYSINKGEQIVFCLRSRHKDRKHNLHDLNLLMYVVLHEMSHVACPEIGHTKLFGEIFQFFVQEAEKIGIYQKINFRETPHEYCGMNINDSF